MKVGVEAKWQDGVILGLEMPAEGLGAPTSLQLFAAAAILEGTKMAGGCFLSLKQTTLPGQHMRVVFPDPKGINGVLFEIGEGVSMLERVALASAIKVVASIYFQGQMREVALKHQRQVPSIAVPGGVRLH